MSDPLFEAVQALRETTSGKEAAVGRYTRARVLAAVRKQKRRRVIHFAFGIPLAAMLIGSGAWAASGQTLPRLVQRVSQALGLRESPSPPAVASMPRRSTPRSAEPRIAAELASSEPPALAEVTSRESLAATQSMQGEATSATGSAGTIQLRTSSKARSDAESLNSANISSASMPRDSRITEQELTLYENAHRAHFIAKDVSRALDAWNEYLRRIPKGRFAVEASYNRALCLVRLGRNSEARKALAPFARGAFGGYRNVEAAALLANLSEDAP